MRQLLTAMTIIGVLLSSCKKHDDDAGAYVRIDSAFAAQLRTTSEAVTIDKNHLVLGVNLYRNFMPGGDYPLICTARLLDRDTLPIPNSITLIRQYVLRGDEIWSAPYVPFSVENDAIWWRIDNGPKYEPYIYVDVICEFSYNGQVFWIMQKAVLVDAVS